MKSMLEIEFEQLHEEAVNYPGPQTYYKLAFFYQLGLGTLKDEIIAQNYYNQALTKKNLKILKQRAKSGDEK